MGGVEILDEYSSKETARLGDACSWAARAITEADRAGQDVSRLADMDVLFDVLATIEAVMGEDGTVDDEVTAQAMRDGLAGKLTGSMSALVKRRADEEEGLGGGQLAARKGRRAKKAISAGTSKSAEFIYSESDSSIPDAPTADDHSSHDDTLVPNTGTQSQSVEVGDSGSDEGGSDESGSDEGGSDEGASDEADETDDDDDRDMAMALDFEDSISADEAPTVRSGDWAAGMGEEVGGDDSGDVGSLSRELARLGNFNRPGKREAAESDSDRDTRLRRSKRQRSSGN